MCLFIRKRDLVVTKTRTVNEFNFVSGFNSVNEFNFVNIFSSGNFCKESLFFNETNTPIFEPRCFTGEVNLISQE